MRLPTIELGAGTYRDPDIDMYNDIQPFPKLDYVCDAREIPEDEGPFTIITSNHLIEHMDAIGQLEFLINCHTLLADRGILLTWTPDLDWIESSFVKGEITKEWHDVLLIGAGRKKVDRHVHLLTQPELKRMLETCGFRVLSIREIGGSIECIAMKEKKDNG